MKIVKVKLAIILFFCTSSFTIAAQSKSDLFKSGQERFITQLTEVLPILQKESLYIKKVSNRLDSIVAKGDINLEKSTNLKERINSKLKVNDSLVSTVNLLIKELGSTGKVKSKLLTYVKTVPAFSENIIAGELSKTYQVEVIENEINKFNISGEKIKLKVILNEASAENKYQGDKIHDLGKINEEQLASGNLDDSTAVAIGNTLSKFQERVDSLNKEIKMLEKRIEAPEDYSVNGTIIKTRILIIDSAVNKNATVKRYSLQMIDEGLKNKSKTLFSLAAFFGPGGYEIPYAKFPQAKTYFSPLVDSLIKFSNKYQLVSRTVTILVNGYADGQRIDSVSKIYDTLTKYLQILSPSREQLNFALSALRAEELSNLFAKLIKSRSREFKTLPKIVFQNFEIGRGEQLPDVNIKNYKEEDERRRIVIVYWSVIPNE
jgi:polyhydroxyalkanoate synthesis regulator phasin